MFGSLSASDVIADLSAQDRAELRRLWYGSDPVWSVGEQGRNATDLDAWLGALRPDDWHEIVTRFDWETGDTAVIVWIAARPDADRATILTILLEQDVRMFEDMRRLRPSEDPREFDPVAALLLDIIAQGLATGHYAQARFALSHDPGVLPVTRDYLAALPDPDPLWTFPDRTWAPCEGMPHRPDFLWDRLGNCQRLHFDDWLQAHLRPH